MIKRILLTAMMIVVAGMAFGALADDRAYPERLIKMIVPAPPGGQTDVLARFLAQRLQSSLGQSVIIENRPGAGGGLGARAAAAAEPDGYTLFFGNTSALAIIPVVSKSPGYDPVKQFAPIASVSESYMILVVHPSFAGKSVQEFIAYAEANPGKLNFAHAGVANVTHLTGEMFKSLAGIDFVNVPYPGGAESVTAVLAQQVDFALESPVILLPMIREGKLRALGVTSAKRPAEASDIPTMAESGMAGFVATLLTGVVAPAGTPPAIVDKLNRAINEALKTAETQAILAKFGSEAKISSPQEFSAYLKAEMQKWGGIAKAARVQID
jgi:tripartite-type tricarboxylate transporter receptor subunit TctC